MAHTFFYDPSFDYSSITLSGKRGGTDTKRTEISQHEHVVLYAIVFASVSNFIPLYQKNG